MKMTTIPVIVVLSLTFSAGLFAGTGSWPGTWDCEVYVDVSYPFLLILEEVDGNLSGKVSRNGGEAAITSVKQESEKLTFQVESAEVGVVDFEIKVAEDQLTGSAGNSAFIGDVTCKRKAE